jgi:membrane protein
MTASPIANTAERAATHWRSQMARLVETLQRWPYLDTAITLRQRFREDRLGLTAGSLTFTTLISLVPLISVMLAAFAAFRCSRASRRRCRSTSCRASCRT